MNTLRKMNLLLTALLVSMGAHAQTSPGAAEPAEYYVQGLQTFSPEHPHTLWYRQPAAYQWAGNAWMEYALPIGNGQLGACLMGGVKQDEIQFNEKTLWEGTPNDMAGTFDYGSYKNFGSVLVTDLSAQFGFNEARQVRDYVRYLDLQTGIGGVDYSSTDDLTHYERRYFASFPDRVVAVRYRATGRRQLDLLVSVKPGDDLNATPVSYSGAYATFGGKLKTVSHAACLRVVPAGADARMESTPDGIRVSGTREVLLVLAGGTDFDAAAPTLTSGTEDVSASR